MVRIFVYVLVVALFLEIEFTHRAAGSCSGTADLGITECVLLQPYYSSYQWATCLSADYISRVASARGKSHHCRDSSAQQCYYQCMIEFYDMDQGPVNDDCSCSATTGAPPISPLPSLAPHCFSPAGNDCSWYRQCLDERYDCSGTRYDYAIGYAQKFCYLYAARYSDFGSVARAWIDATRKCLQVKLVPYLRPWVKATCKDIYSKAFKTHSGCYLAPQSGAPSVCHLPCTDIWKIFWLVSVQGGALLSEPIETSKQMLEVATGCLKERGQDITCLAETVQRLVYVGVKVKSGVLSTKQSIQDFAGSLVSTIAKKLSWAEHGLSWLPFSNNATGGGRQKRTVSGNVSQSELLNVNVLLVNLDDLNITQTTPSADSKTVGQAVDELVDFVQKGELSQLEVAVDGMSLSARVSAVGHCHNVECNETTSDVLATAPSAAVFWHPGVSLILPAFVSFMWNMKKCLN